MEILYTLTIMTDNSEGTLTEEQLAEVLDGVLKRIRETKVQCGNAQVVVTSCAAQ